MNESDIRGLMARVAVGDPTAADEIDALADRLRSLAEVLRAGGANPMTSPGGVGDRCRMRVVGPDGQVKQDAYAGDWSYESQHPGGHYPEGPFGILEPPA